MPRVSWSDYNTWDLFEIKLTDSNGANLTGQIKNLREDKERGNVDYPLNNLIGNKGKLWTYTPNKLNDLDADAKIHPEGQWFEFDLEYTIPKIKVFQKINEIIEYIGTKLNITSGSQNEKIEKILEKQPDNIKEAYLRYMFEFLGFDNTPDNEDFFNKVKDKVKDVFGEDIENEIYGIKESDIKVDTIQNKEKLLNILLNFFTYTDDNNNTKVYKL